MDESRFDVATKEWARSAKTRRLLIASSLLGGVTSGFGLPESNAKKKNKKKGKKDKGKNKGKHRRKPCPFVPEEVRCAGIKSCIAEAPTCGQSDTCSCTFITQGQPFFGGSGDHSCLQNGSCALHFGADDIGSESKWPGCICWRDPGGAVWLFDKPDTDPCLGSACTANTDCPLGQACAEYPVCGNRCIDVCVPSLPAV